MKIGLIGRTNAGKSTLFNRLLGSYRAIVTDIHGTTREIISEKIDIDGNKAILLDSPGLDDFKQELFYIEKIIKESDIILFVIDCQSGILAKDEKIKELILKNGKKQKTLILINKLDSKLDNDGYEQFMSEFYNLGFENLLGISAKYGKNIQGIKDNILELADKFNIPWLTQEEEKTIPIAILGRPNVGKSTLLNRLCQEELSRVDDVNGTTLDYITGEFQFKNKKYKLYDTAGIRRKGKITGLEKIAYDKTLKMIEYVKPVVVVLIDGIQGVTHRDLSLIGDVQKLNVPIIIAVNKIDLISKNEFDKLFQRIVIFFDFAKWMPITRISAKEGIGLPDMLKFVNKIYQDYNMRIPTFKLNKVLNTAWIQSPPTFPKNKMCKFYYASQIETSPPQFLFFINKKDNANFAFKKWLENIIRKSFGFVGIPLVLNFKEKGETQEKDSDE